MGNRSKKPIYKKKERLRRKREVAERNRRCKQVHKDSQNDGSDLRNTGHGNINIHDHGHGQQIEEHECMNVNSPRPLETPEEVPYVIRSGSEDIQDEPIKGRRIIDVSYFIQQLQKISNHSSMFHCNFSDMSLKGESRNGLISKYRFSCNMCQKSFIITSEDPSSDFIVNANMAAVTGITSAGIGYSQFQEITACMDIPIFSDKNYAKIQDMVYEKWEMTATESMEKAAKRERDAAIAEGRLNRDGIPVIDVYADGVWSSRSYGNNYRALSGAAAIVGRKFSEVIFIGIKNKYCLICARAEKKNISAPDHVCYKNYSGSSSGMEADIICQGFETSMEMYGLIYGKLIADGDSATYARILARNPYPNHTVQKIECKNHLLRNMCNKLRNLSKETKYTLQFRKTLTEVRIMSIRKVIILSIKQYKPKKNEPDTFREFVGDIQNAIYHAYGNHNKCKDYYCRKEKSQQSSMEIENSTFWFRMKTIIQVLISKAKSLLEDVDTNVVERFNSVVAKVVGGKRINFSLRRGYRARCAAAVLSYNTHTPRYTLHKKILGRSPRITTLKKFEERRQKKRNLNLANPHKKNRPFKIHMNMATVSHEYGTHSSAPDMEPEELERAKQLFMSNLKELTSNKDEIQKNTRNQRESTEWLDLRKNLITASNFGLVVKRKESSSKAKLVQSILYQSNLSNVASVAHGVENELVALQQLAVQENVNIEPCGLFIDNKYPFIGATPDGLIGDDTVVEVKCPITAFKDGVEKSIENNKIQIYKYNKKSKVTKINTNCNWYMQIQGQLHITQRQKCLFAIWSGENRPLKTEIIDRDDVYWKTKIEPKVVNFYTNWILPEIVDSRRARGMPLREKESSLPSLQAVSPTSAACLPQVVSISDNIKNMCSSPYDSDTEYEPLPKKNCTFDESPIFPSEFLGNRENKPCCSKQLTFDEI